MFIWTIGDAIGFALLLLFGVAFTLLWISDRIKLRERQKICGHTLTQRRIDNTRFCRQCKKELSA
jgi:hypothetical protein